MVAIEVNGTRSHIFAQEGTLVHVHIAFRDALLVAQLDVLECHKHGEELAGKNWSSCLHDTGWRSTHHEDHGLHSDDSAVV